MSPDNSGSRCFVLPQYFFVVIFDVQINCYSKPTQQLRYFRIFCRVINGLCIGRYGYRNPAVRKGKIVDEVVVRELVGTRHRVVSLRQFRNF